MGKITTTACVTLEGVMQAPCGTKNTERAV
jgi:hypothetical protein